MSRLLPEEMENFDTNQPSEETATEPPSEPDAKHYLKVDPPVDMTEKVEGSPAENFQEFATNYLAEIGRIHNDFVTETFKVINDAYQKEQELRSKLETNRLTGEEYDRHIELQMSLRRVRLINNSEEFLTKLRGAKIRYLDDKND